MKQIINTSKAPAPVGPYNQATMQNGMLFVSGQIAIDASTGQLINESIEAETHQVMKNLSYVLDAAGMTFENVLKASVFVADMHQYGQINTVYATYFNEATAPARELVEVANLPKFVNIEISVIAAK